VFALTGAISDTNTASVVDVLNLIHMTSPFPHKAPPTTFS